VSFILLQIQTIYHSRIVLSFPDVGPNIKEGPVHYKLCRTRFRRAFEGKVRDRLPQFLGDLNFKNNECPYRIARVPTECHR
jgi:hypothetical protein